MLWVLGVCAALETWAAASASALRGAALDGTYVLVEPVAGTRRELGLVQVAEERGRAARVVRRHAAPRERKEPHGAFPLAAAFPAAAFLASGSFGEAWRATKAGEPVIIKLFYRLRDGLVEYLAPDRVETIGETDDLIAAEEECEHLQQVVAAAPEGRKRFGACLENKVAGRTGSQPYYLVFADGGQNLEDWLVGPGAKAPLAEKRRVIGMALQALRTTGERLAPPLVHHDLKPANIVYDGQNARLIDFGAALPGNEKGLMHYRVIVTKNYAPPEILGIIPGRPGLAFYKAAPVSFDVFALGLVYAEVLCPGLAIAEDPTRLVPFALSRAKTPAQLAQLFGAHGCTVPAADAAAMLQMLAFLPEDRPLPSRLLAAAPFAAALDAAPGLPTSDRAPEGR